MNWMYSTAKEMKEDVYMVGEDWDGNSAIATSYESGVDSFFNFTFPRRAAKSIPQLTRKMQNLS